MTGHEGARADGDALGTTDGGREGQPHSDAGGLAGRGVTHKPARAGGGGRDDDLRTPLGRAPALDQHTSLGATLAGLGMLALPGVSGVVTTLLYLANGTWTGMLNSSGTRAFVSGTAVGVIVWFVLAYCLRQISCPRGAVPSAWAQVDEERIELRARFDRQLAGQTQPSPSMPEARSAILAAEDRLQAKGSRADWIVGVGYVSVWRHLHRADEALLEASSPEELVAAASHDYLRVVGSTMPQGAILAKMIDAAANRMQPGALASVGGQSAPVGPATIAADPIASLTLRQARRTINDFRDSSRMGLVRARNALALTIGATGILAYLLFGLALVGGATKTQITAGATFYLVGGLVGLFRQLQLASARDTVSQEDFGLQAVRLIHTPLFSGIAAVAGVVLLRIASEPQVLDAASIFNLQLNRADLAIAAVFGLTPNLLISQLQAKAESYKSDLKNTEAGQGGTPQP
jgi:hypothetical protein